jgi:bacteriocin-like protein
MKNFEVLNTEDLKNIKGGINEMVDKPIGDDCIV